MGTEPGPKERRTTTVCPKRKRKSTEPRIGALDVEKQGISPEIVLKVNLREAERLREEALGQTTEGLSIGMITITRLANKESGTSWKSTYPKRPPDASESAGDYYDPVELIDPWEFGEDENLTPVDNSEEKLALVLEEERKFGRPRCLGNALKRRLDHNLEWLQPYPGDPANVLQYRGRRFMSMQTEEGIIHTWDAVWERETTIPCEWVENPAFEIGTWYALEHSVATGAPFSRSSWYAPTLATDIWTWNAGMVLGLGDPYFPHEEEVYCKVQPRFRVERDDQDTCLVADKQIWFVTRIQAEHLVNPRFDICKCIWEEDTGLESLWEAQAKHKTLVSPDKGLPEVESLDVGESNEIRVKPEHVDRTAMTTPDGTMVSHVIQQDNDERATQLITMPVLVGSEGEKACVLTTGKGLETSAEEPVKKKWAYHQKQVEPAETGRAETAKEFAARVAPHFVLQGPHEQNEGGEEGLPSSELEKSIDNNNKNRKLTIKLPGRKKQNLPKNVTTQPEVQINPAELCLDEDLVNRSQRLQEEYAELAPLTLEELLSLAAHDCILGARIKQTRNANRHRQPSPFMMGDMVNRPFPSGYLPSTFVDPRLDLLVTLGFISKQGDVDKQTVKDAVRAWRAPAGQLVQRTKQYHAQRANPYSVSSSKSGNSTRFYLELHNNYSALPAPVGSSSATASSSTPRYPRSNSGSPSSTPVSSVPSPARLSRAAIAAAVTSGGLVIKEKDPKDKGKGKATEEEEMEVNATDVLLPEDDFLDEELQDLLRSPKTHTKKAD
ncbi:hypothetical protein E4T56_gene11740 [Termitomyces sp. T112]|nr:hypothetical protein E4T56_gene11740 [Termitomyces sp. T112]